MNKFTTSVKGSQYNNGGRLRAADGLGGGEHTTFVVWLRRWGDGSDGGALSELEIVLMHEAVLERWAGSAGGDGGRLPAILLAEWGTAVDGKRK